MPYFLKACSLYYFDCSEDKFSQIKKRTAVFQQFVLNKLNGLLQ